MIVCQCFLNELENNINMQYCLLLTNVSVIDSQLMYSLRCDCVQFLLYVDSVTVSKPFDVYFVRHSI